MAKGNDGNYLQHSIEVSLAWQLVSRMAGNHLHVALTHGMAPYEACGAIPNGQTKSLLMDALGLAQRPRFDREPPVVSAYRAARATLERYPNTGELLGEVIGRDQLVGGITERNLEKCAQLKAVWAQSKVLVASASWRSEIQPGGVLSCPDRLGTPWLFSADPMTYHEEGYARRRPAIPGRYRAPRGGSTSLRRNR